MKYTCPLCSGELTEQAGTCIHPDDAAYGITLYCPNQQCPSPEVAGHGDKAKDAYDVILAKFGIKK